MMSMMCSSNDKIGESIQLVTVLTWTSMLNELPLLGVRKGMGVAKGLCMCILSVPSVGSTELAEENRSS